MRLLLKPKTQKAKQLIRRLGQTWEAVSNHTQPLTGVFPGERVLCVVPEGETLEDGNGRLVRVVGDADFDFHAWGQQLTVVEW